MIVLKTKNRRFQPEVNKAKYPSELNGMKVLLLQFATYNIWANQNIMELILALPE